MEPGSTVVSSLYNLTPFRPHLKIVFTLKVNSCILFSWPFKPCSNIIPKKKSCFPHSGIWCRNKHSNMSEWVTKGTHVAHCKMLRNTTCKKFTHLTGNICDIIFIYCPEATLKKFIFLPWLSLFSYILHFPTVSRVTNVM